MAGTSRRDADEIVAAPNSGRTRVRVGCVPRKPRSLWRRRRRWWLGLGALLLVLAAISAVRYWQAYAALQDGRTQVLAAKQLVTGDLSHLDHDRVERAKADLQAAVDDFGPKSHLLADGWLGGIALHLPGIGTNVRGARGLRTAGAAGARLGVDTIAVVDQVIPPDGSNVPPFQRLVNLASQHRDLLDRTEGDVESLRSALAAIPPDPMWGPIDRARQTVISEGTKLVEGAGPALGLLHALPVAIGPGTHTYLFLLENPGEERPGGGYIGAVGVVSFTNGAVSGLDFRGGEAYTALVTSIPAPAPLDQHLFRGQHWELADANWSPDFPTSMAEVERFYELGTGKKVDGGISVDPVALGYVLGVIGPVQVAGYPQVITSTNVLSELNYISNRARPGDPGKVFLPPFGAVLVRGLLHAPIAQMPPLADALQRGAREKHVALYFHDAKLQSLVDGAGYGGRLETPTSDSLLVDDANLSGTKGDLFVKRDMHLTAVVGPDGTVQDTLVLHYDNPRATTPQDQALTQGSGGDYRDYVRVYIPETAQLTGLNLNIVGARGPVLSGGSVPPDAVTYELGHQAIAYWLVVPQGGSATLTVRYSGPFADISVTPEQYDLLWHKQVNALDWDVTVDVTMPGGKKQHWTAPLVTDLSFGAEA